MKKTLSKRKLWEQTPSFVNTTLKRALSIFPPALLLGSKFRATCKSIKQMQWWTHEEIKDYQFGKLREIITLAYEKTKFYRQLFDKNGFNPKDFNVLDDLHKLPIIDKDIILSNIDDMCAMPVDSKDVDFISTGGTSGTPLHFYINTDRSSEEYAHLTTSWGRADYKLGMPMAVLRGRIVKPDKNGLYHEYDPLLRHHYYSTFHLSDENIARYLKHISTIGKCFFHVYPSSATVLASFILQNKIKSPKNIQGILAESEIVYPEQRRMIEEVFGCRLFSCYGQTEKVVLATGCEKSNDYHIWPTYGYFELLDENGRPVTTPGQRGEIIGTGFINTVMPFIRYRTGDLATYVSDHCEKCGRGHIIIRDIRGHRTQEVLVASDGSEISWTSLNMHDDTFIHVRQFQFMQDKPGYTILRVVPSNDFDDKDIAKIKTRLGAKLDNRIKVEIEIVEKITLTNRGKAIYVDQRIQRK